MPDTKTLKIDVPESLAREIRRIAEVSRRSIREVTAAVLGDVFTGIKTGDLRHRWIQKVAGELGEAAPAGNLADDLVNDAEAEGAALLAAEE